LKKFTFLAFAVFSLFTLKADAQVKRCITEEKMQELFRTDPQARLRFEATRRMLDEKVAQYLSNPNARLFRTNAIMTIPVVVHIATATPAQVTDATVQRQLDTLNYYYGAQPNGDSLRVYTPFRTAYGRSQIRFCLAQRDPSNQATTGITRTTTSTVFSTSSGHPSSVAGIPTWNTQQYMNIWVVNFGSSGVLGYSYKPGTFPPGDNRIGYVVDYRAFGSGASYLYPEYNGGKTGVHEIGHYFNLDHPWGPNNSGNPTCTLSDGCDDTPPVNGPFFGCPNAAPVTSTACAAALPNGTMWQNHMDYADDACMVLFTRDQVTRMETALTGSADRNTLLTSQGCQPLVSLPNDAGISAIVSPAAGSSTCANTLVPTVTLRNFGSNTLTTVTITATVNGVAQPGYPFTWNGNLSSNSTVNVTLPPVAIVSGTNNINIATSMPNGVADATPSNDARSVIVTQPVPQALPFTEGFEATTFPPAGWSLVNPDGGTTWTRWTTGVAAAGTAMARINYYNYGSTNQIDELVTPALNAAAAGAGNKVLSFARAYRQYGTAAGDQDTLEILVSPDCGATYTSVWKKWGATLATVTPSNTSSFQPAAATDWVTETIDLTAFATSNMVVRFKGTNRFGNNLFLDNINIQRQANRDMQLVSINTPGTTACSQTVVPQVTVRNTGAETITAFRVSYTLSTAPTTVINTTFSQTLAPGASATVTLNSATTTPGARSIRAYTADPLSTTGVGDVVNNNDTLSKSFTVVEVKNTPVVEGFENGLTPAGWALLNPNNNVTWTLRQPGRNSSNAAFINNYDNNLPAQIDAIRTDFYNVAGADSILFSFDLAHKNYPGSNDTLTILVSTDCGNTYTSVYKKWGTTLATAGASNASYLTPVATDWRNERIALSNTFAASGSVIFQVRNTNQYGNNVFVDNININVLFNRDVRVMAITQPGDLICAGNLTPTARIRNVGKETITGVKVSYSIDNGPVQTTTLTGLSMARDAEMSVPLTAANVTALGAHSIRVFTSDPVSSTGTGDNFTLNDTLRKAFALAGTVQAPLRETFEGTFPPANWSVVNPDAATGWAGHTTGNSSMGSAFINLRNYTVRGQKDDLATPNVNYSGVDSVKLTFDLSAVTYFYPGATSLPMDTVEVLVTRDCGNTFTTVYKKWGEDLQTINDPNFSQPINYFPTANFGWRTETVDLTSFANNSPIMVMFRTTNNQGNNIFIDNVNLTTRTLPANVKQDGYVIMPSPFKNTFSVWHVETPTDLRYISVFNSVGQLIWTQQYNGNAAKVVNVNLTGKAAGTYVVKLGYADENRNKSVRIIKY
jgi:hypothetical protein